MARQDQETAGNQNRKGRQTIILSGKKHMQRWHFLVNTGGNVRQKKPPDDFSSGGCWFQRPISGRCR